MPKHIPEATKLEAMALFLEGDKTAKEIAEVISRDGVVVAPPTIYSWAKKERWGEQQAVSRYDQQQKLIETEGQKYARLQREQLESYTTVAKKGFNELEGLNFDRAFDAVKAIDLGIKGQRDVISGLINLQFVQDVLGILVEELGDDQVVLNKIANKLKALVQNQKEVQ